MRASKKTAVPQSPPYPCTPILIKAASSRNLRRSLIRAATSFPLPQFQIPKRQSERAAKVSTSLLILEWLGPHLRGRCKAGCSPPSARIGDICHRAWVLRPHQAYYQLPFLVFQKDPVCYLKKAFVLMQDIMEDTMRFKDNTPNANVIVKLQELSLRLKSCFTKDYEEQDKVGVSWGALSSKSLGWLWGYHPCPYTQSVFACLSPRVIVHSLSHSFIHPTHLC